jgi:hypothetical protein
MGRSSNFAMDQDLFDDMPIGGDHPVAAPTAAPKAPKLTPQQKVRQLGNQIGAATRHRNKWEASPEGQARSKDINDLATEHYNSELGKRGMKTMGGASAISRTQMSKAQLYSGLGVTNEGHGHGDQQLPGMENPHSAPEPPRWEDIPDKQKTRTNVGLKLQGTNIDKMKSDFGAQLDQSVWRAHMAGHHDSATGEPTPFTAHFYGEHPSTAPEPLDRPKEMLRESRHHLQGEGVSVDPSVQIAVVGHTSPNVKFTQGERGARQSPNIEAAESVIKQHDQGLSSYEVTSGKNRKGVTNQTRPANARRAARMMEHVDSGQPLATARNAPSATDPMGSSQWGPKTGPFANSFDASKPDFLVGDVHTLGGGMFPHHGTTKPVAISPVTGQRRRVKAFANDPRSDTELHQQVGERIAFSADKSGREKAIEKSGTTVPPEMAPSFKGKSVTTHSAADYAARQAIAERGLGTSVRRPQASQWGEEQLQRGVASPKLDVPHHDEAYPSQKALIHPGQMKLFG